MSTSTAANDKAAGVPHVTGAPVRLSDIHADYAWNTRAERNVQDMEDLESSGFEGFKNNIRDGGQVTAVILRNTGGKTLGGAKTDKPFELICGFRRHRAITLLNTDKAETEKAKKERNGMAVPNLPNGTILAEVRDVADVTHARILNGVENTARKNLKAPDMVFLVKDLQKAGMTQQPIADALGITQGWVSRLQTVGKLPLAVLEHWRERKAIPPVTTRTGVYELKDKAPSVELTEPEMRKLAHQQEVEEKTPEEMTARYIRKVKPEVQADGPGLPTPVVDKVKENVAEMAAFLGCMVKAGFLQEGSLDWSNVIGPKKKGFPIDCGPDDSRDRLAELKTAAKIAFDEEVAKLGATTSKATNANV
jgi:hypothetical protein